MEEDKNGVENVSEIKTINLANTNATEKKTDGEGATFDFEEKSWRTDFTLIVEGTKLYVSKTILSLASPVFDRMFGSDFKEGSCDELDLPGKKLDDMKEFLRCIYPNALVPITMKNALTLLPIVDEYQVLHLKARCESVLMDNVGNETPAKELFQRLRDAEMYQLKLLRQKCISLASRKTQTELEEAKNECRPPAEDLVEILESVAADLRKNIADLEEENSTLSKEIDVWKSYVSANIKESKELAFDNCIKWKEMNFVLTVPVSNGYCASVLKEIWDIPIEFLVSTVERELEYTIQKYLQLEIKSGKDIGRIVCQMNIKCDFVNMQPYGKNESFNSKHYCDGGVVLYLKKVEYLNAVSSGFIYEGNIFIIVHLYMSEPNKK